jgi:cold shock CspA family protein
MERTPRRPAVAKRHISSLQKYSRNQSETAHRRHGWSACFAAAVVKLAALTLRRAGVCCCVGVCCPLSLSPAPAEVSTAPRDAHASGVAKDADVTYRGTVKLFSLERGYGFIKCESISTDVYVTRVNIEKPKGFLRGGDLVEFHILRQKGQVPQAVRVRRLKEDGTEDDTGKCDACCAVLWCECCTLLPLPACTAGMVAHALA